MIYGVERQASVESDSYDTLARIDRKRCYDFCADYPQFKQVLLSYINILNDKNQRRRKDFIRMLPFINDDTPELVVLDLAYALDYIYYELDHYFLTRGLQPISICFIEYGEIVATTQMNDKFEFLIERLGRNSVINMRNVFSEDITPVDYRVKRQSCIYYLPIAKIHQIAERHPHLQKALALYENKIFSKDRTYPLDYMVGQYPILKSVGLKDESQRLASSLERRNVFKNCVMREIVAQRQVAR